MALNTYLLKAGLVASLVSVAAPISAAAQSPAASRSNTNGLLLALAPNGSSIDSDDLESDAQSGGGFAAQLGWGFIPMFTLLAGAGGARIDQDGGDFVLIHFDLLGRFNFRSGQSLVPFVEGGLTARVAGQDDAVVVDSDGTQRTVDLEISGGAFTLGGGINYFVNPTVALGASLQVSGGEFSTVKFNNVSIDGFELDATSTRLNLVLTWYPMRGR